MIRDVDGSFTRLHSLLDLIANNLDAAICVYLADDGNDVAFLMAAAEHLRNADRTLDEPASIQRAMGYVRALAWIRHQLSVEGS